MSMLRTDSLSLQPWPANEAVWKYGDRCRREGLRASQGVINLAMEESLSDVRTCSFDFQIKKGKWDSTIDSAGALALDVASLAGIPTGLSDIPITGVFISAAEAKPANFESYFVSVAAGFATQMTFLAAMSCP